MSNLPEHLQRERAKRVDDALAAIDSARHEPPPPLKAPELFKRLSPEDIIDQIHRLAREGEGADQRWALSQLQVGDASITVPKPLTQDEIDRRTARILKGIGIKSTQRAYRIAFPTSVPKNWTEAERHGVDYLPTSLNDLYARFPEAEKNADGIPPDYPRNASSLKRQRWIAKYASELNLKRKEANGHQSVKPVLDVG